MANPKFVTGDKIVFGRGRKNKHDLHDVTIGRIYTVAGVTNEEAYFIDDAGDANFAASPTGDGKATKIID